MAWADITALLILGLASSGHCVGMCGGFALAVGRGVPGAGSLAIRHFAYQSGKALTYVFLAVLLTAGFSAVGNASWFAGVQTALAVLAGAVMLVYGLMQVLEIRAAPWWNRVFEPIAGCRAFAVMARAPGPLAAFGTGWLNGFLPCGLLVSVLLMLASRHDVVGAAIGAAVFGFSTMPGLFAFTLAAHAWKPGWRRALVRVTGALLITFGAVTLLRAFPAGRHWLHQVLPAQMHQWCGV